MAAIGTYLQRPSLVEPLPPLVRKQRRLAKVIAKVAPLVVEEKGVRAQIDVLLMRAGLKKSELVTCAGYDVRHNERDGQTSINADAVIEACVAGGVDRAFIVGILKASEETGETATFATVTPSKGATVRP